MNLPSNLSKSCLLAAVIFWIIIATEEVDIGLTPFMFLSLIPIFFVVTIVVIGSICSIFWLRKSETFGNKAIFKTFYPYYAIIAFGICSFGIIASDFDIYIIAFFTSAFITTSQCWVWFAKEKD